MNSSRSIGDTSPGRYAISLGMPKDRPPEGWVWTPLSNVAALGTGHTPSRRRGEYWDGAIPWLGIKDAAAHHGHVIYDTFQHTNELGLANSATRLLPKGTVCLSRTASVGYVIVLGREMATSQDFVTWTTVEEALDPHFLKLALMAEGRGIARFGKGTTHTTIYLTEAKALYVCIPPINEQRRIVKITDAILLQGTKATRALEGVTPLLDNYRQAILGSAYRGNLTRKWRSGREAVETANDLVSKTPVPEQPRGGRRPTTRVISGEYGLSVNVPPRRAPSGWSWIPLSRVARQETGHTPSRRKPEYWNGNISWIGIRDARDHHGKHIFETAQHITVEGLENSAARVLPKNTVCLSRTASIGYTVIMGEPMATSQDFVCWTCSKAILPEFLMYLFLAEGEHLRRFGRGTTHTTIYFPELRALHVCLPPLAEQRRIVEICDHIVSGISKVKRTIGLQRTRLENLSRTVLSTAVRGELIAADPSDEPISIVLDRVTQIGEVSRMKQRLKPVGRIDRMQQRPKRGDIVPVIDVLREAEAPMSARHILAKAGYPLDAGPEMVERFFLDLREQIQVGAITRHREDNEDFFSLQM